MHVPKSETNLLEILSFQEALAACTREDWLYVPEHYTEYRYILGTRGQNPLICVGINPSTAEPGNLDNTCKSVERIALRNGFDSFLMFNVYAQRATDPDHMDHTLNETLHRENMAAFAYLLSLSPAPTVWAAWGTIIEKRPYLRDCLREMIAIGEEAGASWRCAGECSKAMGHPHHPLYLRKDAELEIFDVKNYLIGLENDPVKHKRGKN